MREDSRECWWRAEGSHVDPPRAHEMESKCHPPKVSVKYHTGGKSLPVAQINPSIQQAFHAMSYGCHPLKTVLMVYMKGPS